MSTPDSSGGITGGLAPGDAPDTSIEETADESAEQTEEGSDESQQQAEPTAEAKKVAALKRKFKLKVDGEEFEEEFDLDNEQEIIKKLQLSKVAQKRMQEKASLERDVEQFLTDLRTNPKKVLADPRIGLDIKRLAAEIIEEEIEQSKKSPEQVEREKMESELRQLREEREKEKKEAQERELSRLQQQEFERYDMLMTKTLEKSDLPKSPYVVKKMAENMLIAIQEGLDVTPEDVLPIVREEIQNDIREMFSAMPDEVIEGIVGKEVFNRVRKKNVAKVKSQPLKAKVQDTGTKNEKPEAPVQKKTFKDFFGV